MSEYGNQRVTNEDIDRALSADPPIATPPGFRAGVMRRVRAERALPPIAFPWRRVGFAVILAAVALGATMATGAERMIVPEWEAVTWMLVLAAAARLAARAQGVANRHRERL